MTMHFAPPGAQARASGALTARSRLLHDPTARSRLEATLERWIALLDDLDGDPDLEPSLASTTGLMASSPFYITLADDDREEACEDEGAPTGDDEPDADGEPNLGWTLSLSQLHLHRGAGDDREGEHDGREPDEDREPEDFA